MSKLHSCGQVSLGNKEKGRENGEESSPPLPLRQELAADQALPSLALLPPTCFDVYFMRINKHSFHFGKVFAVMYCQRSQQ